MTPEKFESLAMKHMDAVYRQMARVCNHQQDAEDALATAMMHALQHAEQLQSESNFSQWLVTIGKRVCTRMRRHQKMEEIDDLIEEKFGNSISKSNFEPMEVQVIKGCVKEAIDSLEQKYRSVYELCEIEEWSVADAAKKLGISTAAVKSRLLRARQQIREKLTYSICSQDDSPMV